MGYFGYAYYCDNKTSSARWRFKMVPAAKPVLPSPETIADKSYHPWLGRCSSTSRTRRRTARGPAFLKYYLENVEKLASRSDYDPPTAEDKSQQGGADQAARPRPDRGEDGRQARGIRRRRCRSLQSMSRHGHVARANSAGVVHRPAYATARDFRIESYHLELPDLVGARSARPDLWPGHSRLLAFWEGWSRWVLASARLVTILTTLGIVLVLGVQTVEFFQSVKIGILEFLIGTEFKPDAVHPDSAYCR